MRLPRWRGWGAFPAFPVAVVHDWGEESGKATRILVRKRIVGKIPSVSVPETQLN
jgi:hypothetical protein